MIGALARIVRSARLLLLLCALGACGLHRSSREGADLPAPTVEGPPASPTRSDPHGDQGFVLPGEFEPTQELFLPWDEYLTEFYLQILEAATPVVPVTVLIDPSQPPEVLLSAMAERRIPPRNFRLVTVPIESNWLRDYGPLVVRGRGGQRKVVKFGYPSNAVNNLLVARLRKVLGQSWPLEELPFRLEGGWILSNGGGICAVTDRPYAVAGEERAEINAALARHLGCKKLVVLEALERDPTAHVDMFLAITGRNTALVGRFSPAFGGQDAARLDRSAARLEEAGFAVERIPMPEGPGPAPRTYTNLLAINGAVLVPVYADAREHEARALQIIARAYPGRRIRPIDSTEIIKWNGAVHCVTMSVAR